MLVIVWRMNGLRLAGPDFLAVDDERDIYFRRGENRQLIARARVSGAPGRYPSTGSFFGSGTREIKLSMGSSGCEDG